MSGLEFEKDEKFKSTFTQLNKSFEINTLGYETHIDEKIALFFLAKRNDFKEFQKRYYDIFPGNYIRDHRFITLKSISNALGYKPLNGDFLDEIEGMGETEIFIRKKMWSIGSMLITSKELDGENLNLHEWVSPPCINSQINAAVIKGHAADFESSMGPYILKWKDKNPVALRDQIEALEKHFLFRKENLKTSASRKIDGESKILKDMVSKKHELREEYKKISTAVLSPGDSSPQDKKESIKKEFSKLKKQEELLVAVNLLQSRVEYEKIISFLHKEKVELTKIIKRNLTVDISEGREDKLKRSPKKLFEEFSYDLNLELGKPSDKTFESRIPVRMKIQPVKIFKKKLPPLPVLNESILSAMIMADANSFDKKFVDLCAKEPGKVDQLYVICMLIEHHFMERHRLLVELKSLRESIGDKISKEHKKQIRDCDRIYHQVKSGLEWLQTRWPSLMSRSGNPSSHFSEKKSKVIEKTGSLDPPSSVHSHPR